MVIFGLACFAASSAKAQVPSHVGVNASSEPLCPYGYFSYTLFECTPYGYYSSEWSQNGAFLGASPWYRSAGPFNSSINNYNNLSHSYHRVSPRSENREYIHVEHDNTSNGGNRSQSNKH